MKLNSGAECATEGELPAASTVAEKPEHRPPATLPTAIPFCPLL